MSNNNEEIEAVFLEVDKEVIENKLTEIGAVKKEDIFYRHVSMDFPDYRLDNDNSWVRLRDDGTEVQLAFKKRLGVTSQDGSANDAGMEEVETVVGSYEDTKALLLKIGLIEKHEAEKKRTRWIKDDVEFDIDTWPELPTFLEIEAQSWEDIDTMAQALGLNPEDKKICSVNQIYRMYDMDVNDYSKLSFDGLVKK